jgi:small-conductance mechanosensitive channel
VELPQFRDLVGDIGALGIAIIAAIIGLVIHWLVDRAVRRAATLTPSRADEVLIRHTRRPVRVLIIIAAVLLSTMFMGEEGQDIVRFVGIFVGIIALGWLLVALTGAGYEIAMSRFPQDSADDLEERHLKTQLQILQRFGSAIIWIVAVAVALLTIPGVQPLAASMLAGAGVAGIVLGLAAGPTIGNLIAGLQIAFTRPIKVGDVVVIDGEWGHIGEITVAYVVVDIWDKRRLIVPLSQIINQPVENWTRRTTDLLGTVKLYLDYRAPIDDIRVAYRAILDESGLWDGEAWSVLVTGADDRTITVRALYSAPDASVEWNLRCLVREKLIGYLQQEHPYALPTAREMHVEGKAELAV